MTDAEARKLVMQILGEADYDLMKSFDPETSEDVEESERTMKRLIELVHYHVPQTDEEARKPARATVAKKKTKKKKR